MSPSDLAVGTTLCQFSVPPIGRSTLALFADASGDHNPMHIDRDAAREAGMSDVFAHGMLVMAYAARMLTQSVRQDAIREFGLRFVAITPIGAAPTCTATVGAIETLDGETRVTLNLDVTVGDGTVVARGTAIVADDIKNELAL